MDNFFVPTIKQQEINSKLIDDNIITISDILEKLNSIDEKLDILIQQHKGTN